MRRQFSLLVSFLFLSVANSLSLPVFAPGNPWNQDISSWPVDPNSTAITTWLNNTAVSGISQYSWGQGQNLRIGADFFYFEANCTTPRVAIVERTSSTTTSTLTSFSSYYTGDCEDTTGLLFPLPVQGQIEGGSDSCTGWWCPCSGDCHVLVYDTDSKLLYESYQSQVQLDSAGIPTTLHSGCVVIWNTTYVYPPDLRGDGCTSVDAAGFPIAPLLFTPEEIQAGEIAHALRFILPNPKIRSGHYAHPATHYGGPTAAFSSFAPIYGSRWRLKASVDISSRPAHAQTILKALKRYGMLLSDGGNIALTAVADTFQSVKWADTTMQTNFNNAGNGLFGINPSDFEVVAIPGSDHCTNDPGPSPAPSTSTSTVTVPTTPSGTGTGTTGTPSTGTGTGPTPTGTGTGPTPTGTGTGPTPTGTGTGPTSSGTGTGPTPTGTGTGTGPTTSGTGNTQTGSSTNTQTGTSSPGTSSPGLTGTSPSASATGTVPS